MLATVICVFLLVNPCHCFLLSPLSNCCEPTPCSKARYLNLKEKKVKLIFLASLYCQLQQELFTLYFSSLDSDPQFFIFAQQQCFRPVTLDHYHSIFFILCNTNYSHSIPSNMMHYHYQVHAMCRSVPSFEKLIENYLKLAFTHPFR